MFHPLILSDMEIYFVHPVEKNADGSRQTIRVSSRFERGRKKFEWHKFTIDLPGTWWEDKFNCHVDGCDYACDTMESALERGAAFYCKPHQFVFTNDKFGMYGNQ